MGGNAQTLQKYLLERGYRQLRETEEQLGEPWIKEAANEPAAPLITVQITEEEYRALKMYREGPERALEREIDRKTEEGIEARRARMQKKTE
jgi:hypothetical protein